MKSKLLFLLLILTQILSAQTFVEVPQLRPFAGIMEGAIAFSDVDGDNDLDVLLTGIPNQIGRISKLYLNDGTGSYTEVMDTPFEPVRNGSIAFSDVDGDNDPDVLITGKVNLGFRISKLYMNDGMGNFTEATGTPFDGVNFSSIAFSDVDGDNDSDVLITGRDNSFEPSSKLYLNDGTGNYTVVTGTPFDGVNCSSIAFSDVDGDNDSDVLIMGENGSFESSTKLYFNDGTGNYTEVTGTPFDDVEDGSIAFSDVDGDNDPDVHITGRNNSEVQISKLYLNDGMGNYTEVTGTPFGGVENSSAAFSDVDGDNDQDLLITGRDNSFEPSSKLYLNDGIGNYTEATGTPFDDVERGSIVFGDVDGDNDLDVLITGLNGSGTVISKLYLNDGTGSYTEVAGTPFDGVEGGSIAFSDVDGDNDQDVLITGLNGSGTVISKLYLNDGTGGFIERLYTPFEGVFLSSIAFSDVDGDNDSDVLITGLNNTGGRISKLYLNDGTGSYTEVADTPFEGVSFGSIAFSDVDGDNDSDVLITGRISAGIGISKLYLNDGGGNYTEATGTPFEGVNFGSIALADVDGDNDQDVLLTGRNNLGTVISRLYMNNGTGGYTEASGTPFDGVEDSSIAFADVDGDNDPDVLITGENNSVNNISKLYLNNGGGNYTEATGTPFEGVFLGSIAFSDVDGDNDPDVLITGTNNSENQISKLYMNDGSGNYTEATGTPFDGVNFGSIAFSDVDGDNDPDVLITGWINSGTGVRISKLYLNEGLISSTSDLKIGISLDFIPFPNPCPSATLYLNYTATEMGEVTAKVYDMKGIQLKQQSEFTIIGQQNISIDIASLTPGNYYIELDNGKRRGVAKFIVQ